MHLEDLQIIRTLELAEVAFVQSWHAAVYHWLNSPDSTGWTGGDFNLLLMIAQIDLMGLTDALDKQTALTRAYEVLKADNALQPTDVHLN